jgi:hypothetical protein
MTFLSTVLLSGSQFTRKQLTIDNTPVSGSLTEFGAGYVLLNVSVNNPCRIRLYSDSASVGIDTSRPTASFDFNDAVGLVLDTVITSQSFTLNFDPPIFGTTFADNQTWYNISGSGVIATFTYYPIELTPNSRQSLDFKFNSVSTSDVGNIPAPKSFLILSASCNYANTRLRTYSQTVAIPGFPPSSEIVRTFSTTPNNQDNLIADMLFDSASYGYKLTPTLQAYNLQQYIPGESSVGYIFQNLAGGTITNVTASLYVYPLEG